MIRPIPHRTGVTVVQHPAERDHAFGTARLVRMALPDADVRVAWRGGRLERPPLPDGAALLWPGPTARDLAQIPPNERPAHLVVVDGTWPQARSMYKVNPWMAAIPQVRLSPSAPSAYRIRREPRPDFLSTVESLAEALRLCEPENAALDGLLDGFRALIDGQIARRAEVPRQPRPIPERPRALEVLAQRWPDVVVVYAETTPLDREPRAREIAQWAAYRPATGEVFDGITRPTVIPHECQLEQMGLAHGELERAPAVAEVAAAWEHFRRPTDLYAAWSRGGAVAGFLRLGLEPPRLADLKSLYCNVRRTRSGTLDVVVAREGLGVPAVDVRGRAASRLANSAAVVRWLCDRGHEVAALRVDRATESS